MLWIGYPTFNQFIWRQSNRTVHVDISSPWFSLSLCVYIYIYTPWTNKAPARKPSQKETIVFQPSISRCYSHACFKGVYINSKSIQALLFISNQHLWTLWHQKNTRISMSKKKSKLPQRFFLSPLFTTHVPGGLNGSLIKHCCIKFMASSGISGGTWVVPSCLGPCGVSCGTHMLHGTGIFTCMYHKSKPHVGYIIFHTWSIWGIVSLYL